jgi:aminoglycoside phosphotransferase
MDFQNVIIELTNKEIIQPNLIEFEPLKGGTSSRLYLLRNSNNERFVVKLNEPQILESEAYFLDFYKGINLLPNLVYVEQSYKYIVYSFVSGSANYVRKNKKEILTSLVQSLINNYKPVPNSKGWGWADDVKDSWQDFLLSQVLEAKKTLDSNLEKEDFNFVLELVKSPNRNTFNGEAFLLHGDCGVHNFIYKEEQLVGVIDPIPVFGDPLYDLIYAFCSSPDDLTEETINLATSYLVKGNKSEQLLYEEVLIGLYLRLARCIKHHPNDLDEYLKAWNHWKRII